MAGKVEVGRFEDHAIASYNWKKGIPLAVVGLPWWLASEGAKRLFDVTNRTRVPGVAFTAEAVSLPDSPFLETDGVAAVLTVPTRTIGLGEVSQLPDASELVLTPLEPETTKKTAPVATTVYEADTLSQLVVGAIRSDVQTFLGHFRRTHTTPTSPASENPRRRDTSPTRAPLTSNRLRAA